MGELRSERQGYEAREPQMKPREVRFAVGQKVKSLLLRGHPFWSRIIPEFYYPYKFTGGRIYLNIKESPMMLARALGCYEVAKHLALDRFLSSGGVFIDVGANKGDFSLLASCLVGRRGQVLAFEPDPDNCRWIKKSIRRNQYTNINLYEIALSDNNGDAEFYLGEKSGWHTLIPGQPGRGSEVIRVRTWRLDDFLKKIEFNCSITAIKIDVEGADLHVLKGAHNTLLKNNKIILFLDIHPQFGVNSQEVCAYLENLGFSIFTEQPPFDIKVEDYSSLRSLIAMRVSN